MALQFSTTLRTARAGVIESTIGAASVTVEIRTGTPPANAAASDTGSLLATVVVPSDWLGTASAGAVAIANAPWTITASGTGTPGHFRMKTSTTTHIQGTAGTSATDMILDAATLTAGQTFNINSFTITDGNA